MRSSKNFYLTDRIPKRGTKMEDIVVNKDNNQVSNRKWVKILTPILIIVIVFGIYAYKKAEYNKQITQNTENMQTESTNQNTHAIVKEDVKEESAESSEESLSLEISSVDLDEIKSYGLPFVIDFGSDSCKPCKAMAPVLETLHEEWKDKAIVHFVDVWKNTTAAKDFPISLIPTQVFYNADGTPFVPSEELAQEIEFSMYGSKDTNEHLFTIHQGGITEEEMRKIFAEMGVE